MSTASNQDREWHSTKAGHWRFGDLIRGSGQWAGFWEAQGNNCLSTGMEIFWYFNNHHSCSRATFLNPRSFMQWCNQRGPTLRHEKCQVIRKRVIMLIILCFLRKKGNQYLLDPLLAVMVNTKMILHLYLCKPEIFS